MKNILTTLALTTALVLPGAAMAREITLTGTLKNYRGDGAYLAVYVTNANGGFVGTVWVGGGKSKYFDHFTHWFRATGGNTATARTGASVGAGRSFEITFNLSDAMIDAGYQLRIDASVEDMRDAPSDIVIPITSENFGTTNSGRRYIRSVSLR
ncbi:MAG: DUF2271 domain-containing protein [Rhodobacteraceae bacterium]|nr:DUF2271 domain-containing protein [Paracoccaceae bacterium]